VVLKTVRERIYKPATTILICFWIGFYFCYDRGHADRELYVGFYRGAEIYQKL
jgi:putative methionine-R-sulfoxide reductase with GAF domain